MREAILNSLRVRFGDAAEGLAAVMEPIEDRQRLDELVKVAAGCPDLAAYEERLRAQ